MATSYFKRAAKAYFQYAKTHQILVDYKSRFYGFVLSIIGWALIAISMEYIDVEILHPSFLVYTTIKFLTSFLFLYILAKCMRVGLNISDANEKTLGTHFNVKTRKFFLYTRGFLAVASYFTLVWASRRIGLVDNSAVFGIDPVIYGIIVMRLFLKEKLSISSWIGILIATSGVFLIFIANGIHGSFQQALWGIIIGLVSSFAYSLMFVMNSTMIQHEPAVRMAFYEALVGTFLCLILIAFNINDTFVAIKMLKTVFVFKAVMTGIMFSISLLFLFSAFLYTEVILIATGGYSLDIFSSIFLMLKEHLFNWLLALTNGLIILGTAILYNHENKKKEQKGPKFFRPIYRKNIITMYEELEKLCQDKKISVSNYNHAKREYNTLLFKFADKTKKGTFSLEIIDGNVIFTIKELKVNLISDDSLKATALDLLNFDLSKIFIVKSLVELTKKSRTILNFCSHTGIVALSIAAQNKEAKIYAFEVVDFIKDMLRKNIEYNHAKNVVVVEQKVSNIVGGEIFYYLPEESILVPKDHACIYTGLDEVACNSTTIDYFVEENQLKDIDFIGGGCTGDELLKLQGGEKTIKTFKPILYFEIDDTNCLEYGYESKEIFKLLKSWGYHYFENKKVDNNINYCLFLDEKRYKEYEDSPIIKNFTREYKI